MQFNKLFVLAIVAFLGCNSSGNNAKQEELHLSPVAVEKPVPQDALISINQPASFTTTIDLLPV